VTGDAVLHLLLRPIHFLGRWPLDFAVLATPIAASAWAFASTPEHSSIMVGIAGIVSSIAIQALRVTRDRTRKKLRERIEHLLRERSELSAKLEAATMMHVEHLQDRHFLRMLIYDLLDDAGRAKSVSTRSDSAQLQDIAQDIVAQEIESDTKSTKGDDHCVAKLSGDENALGD
jgi:hypothetical protein